MGVDLRSRRSRSSGADHYRNGSSRRQVLTALGATVFAPAVQAQPALRALSIPVSSTSFASLPVRATEALGIFARNGLKVTATVLESGSNVTAALISGSVQVSLGGSGEQIAAASRGQPVVVLTNVYWGQPGTLLLAPEVAERSGVSPTASVRDRYRALEGLTIASVSASSPFTVSFRGAGDRFGVKMNFVYMGQPSMMAALESGAIKGFISSAPLWGPAALRGRAVEWISAPKGDLPDKNVPRASTSYQVMRPFAEANPDLMQQVLQSHREFSDVLVQTPDKVRAVLSGLYPSVAPEALDILFRAEHGAWKMRYVTIADMRHEIEFVGALGAVPNLDRVDPASLLYLPTK